MPFPRYGVNSMDFKEGAKSVRIPAPNPDKSARKDAIYMIYMDPEQRRRAKPVARRSLPLGRGIPALYPFWEGGFPCPEWYISAH